MNMLIDSRINNLIIIVKIKVKYVFFFILNGFLIGIVL